MPQVPDSNTTLYEPLGEGEIRLLGVRPGDFEDDLMLVSWVGKLEELEFSYYALSYVWGDQVARKKAWVDDKNVDIGVNLDCALRHIRIHAPKGLWIWIDALCINQQDITERNQQVAFMAGIFSLAGQVIIWLGPKCSKDDFFLTMCKWKSKEDARKHEYPRLLDSRQLEEISRRLGRTWLSDCECDSPDVGYSWISDAEEIDKEYKLEKSFTSICLRSWFERTWIIQEFALARRDPMFHVGTEQLSWVCLQTMIEYERRWKGNNTGGNFTGITWNELPNSTPSRADHLWRMREIYTKHGGSTLLEIIRSSLRAAATDPRDKVFGILSLCTWDPVDHIIVADYAKSVAQVYSEATLSMLQRNNPYLQFPLCLPCDWADNNRRRVLPGLPSWAINLDIPSESPLEAHAENMLRFSKNVEANGRPSRPPNPDGDQERNRSLFRHHVAVSHEFTRLHTQGLPLGTIVATCDMRNARRKENREECLDTFEQLQQFYYACLKPRQVPLRRLLETVAFNHGRVSTGHVELWEDFVLHHENMLRLDPRAYKDYWEYILDHCRKFRRDHVLFITDQGRVGNSYHPGHNQGPQVGDEVVSLFVSDIPFVLRPIAGDLDGSPAYTMLNIAFVAGHSWGHDFLRDTGPDAQWEDFGDRGMRKYVIV